jgi:hypothetical protein
MKRNSDFQNLRILPSGFQVAIMRQRITHTKHFAGHSVDSYIAAVEHRDRMLRKLPPLSRKGFRAGV